MKITFEEVGGIKKTFNSIEEFERHIISEYDEDKMRSNRLWIMNNHDKISNKKLIDILSDLEQLGYLSDEGIGFKDFIYKH